MKKFICLLLAFTFLLIFAACGDESVPDSIVASTESDTTEVEVETQQNQQRKKKLQSCKQLRQR